MTPSTFRGLVAALGAAVLAVGTAGCGGGATAGATSGAASAGVASSAVASPADGSGPSTPTTSTSKQAWAMGTKVTFTNNTGQAVQVSYFRDNNWTALPAGGSVSETDDYEVMGTTWIPEYVKYPDGKQIEIEVHNPTTGYPYFKYYADGDFSDDYTMKEGDTRTVSISGHNVTFTRLTDDDSITGNKNWTVTLDS